MGDLIDEIRKIIRRELVEDNEGRRILPEPKKDQPSWAVPTYSKTVDDEPIYSSDIGPVTFDPLGRAKKVRLTSIGYVSEPRSPY